MIEPQVDGDKLYREGCNRRLAIALREVLRLHEASWTDQGYQANFSGELIWYGKYRRDESDCIREVVGDDPIALILDCLFTAGFSEMWDFCDQVLGPTAEGRKPSETGEG